MNSRSIYITTANRDEAVAIGSALVEERLAACANVINDVTSIYRWAGSIETDTEAVLLLKTRADLVDAAVDRVKELHSYDTPCVVAWEIVAGNADYLDWITSETRGGAHPQ